MLESQEPEETDATRYSINQERGMTKGKKEQIPHLSGGQTTACDACPQQGPAPAVNKCKHMKDRSYQPAMQPIVCTNN
jgi:hypothetical protein